MCIWSLAPSVCYTLMSLLLRFVQQNVHGFNPLEVLVWQPGCFNWYFSVPFVKDGGANERKSPVVSPITEVIRSL